MHLIAGATGFLGTDICRRLVERGHRVRALARESSDPSRLETLKELGVEIAIGDLREPEMVAAACRDADVVISTVTSIRSRQPGDGFEATDTEGNANLIRAAREGGAGRFVFISVSGRLGGEDPLTRAKRRIEETLRRSGLDLTILRPSFFMEIWLGPHTGFDYPHAKATIFGKGTNPISFISQGDVAELAVRTSLDPDAANRTIELGGPQALTPLEVVRIFESKSGRTFEVGHVSEEALREALESAEDPVAKTFASLRIAYARGDAIPMDATLADFPVTLRTVEDYASALFA